MPTPSPTISFGDIVGQVRNEYVDRRCVPQASDSLGIVLRLSRAVHELSKLQPLIQACAASRAPGVQSAVNRLASVSEQPGSSRVAAPVAAGPTTGIVPCDAKIAPMNTTNTVTSSAHPDKAAAGSTATTTTTGGVGTGELTPAPSHLATHFPSAPGGGASALHFLPGTASADGASATLGLGSLDDIGSSSPHAAPASFEQTPTLQGQGGSPGSHLSRPGLALGGGGIVSGMLPARHSQKPSKETSPVPSTQHCPPQVGGGGEPTATRGADGQGVATGGADAAVVVPQPVVAVMTSSAAAGPSVVATPAMRAILAKRMGALAAEIAALSIACNLVLKPTAAAGCGRADYSPHDPLGVSWLAVPRPVSLTEYWTKDLMNQADGRAPIHSSATTSVVGSIMSAATIAALSSATQAPRSGESALCGIDDSLMFSSSAITLPPSAIGPTLSTGGGGKGAPPAGIDSLLLNSVSQVPVAKSAAGAPPFLPTPSDPSHIHRRPVRVRALSGGSHFGPASSNVPTGGGGHRRGDSLASAEEAASGKRSATGGGAHQQHHHPLRLPLPQSTVPPGFQVIDARGGPLIGGGSLPLGSSALGRVMMASPPQPLAALASAAYSPRHSLSTLLFGHAAVTLAEQGGAGSSVAFTSMTSSSLLADSKHSISTTVSDSRHAARRFSSLRQKSNGDDAAAAGTSSPMSTAQRSSLHRGLGGANVKRHGIAGGRRSSLRGGGTPPDGRGRGAVSPRRPSRGGHASPAASGRGAAATMTPSGSHNALVSLESSSMLDEAADDDEDDDDQDGDEDEDIVPGIKKVASLIHVDACDGIDAIAVSSVHSWRNDYF